MTRPTWRGEPLDDPMRAVVGPVNVAADVELPTAATLTGLRQEAEATQYSPRAPVHRHARIDVRVVDVDGAWVLVELPEITALRGFTPTKFEVSVRPGGGAS